MSDAFQNFIDNCEDECPTVLTHCGRNEQCISTTFQMMQIQFQNDLMNNHSPESRADLTDAEIFDLLPDCLQCVSIHFVASEDRLNNRGEDENDETISRPTNVPQVISWESKQNKGECSAYRSHRTEPVQNIQRIFLSYLVDRGYKCPALPKNSLDEECQSCRDCNLYTSFAAKWKKQIKDMRFYDAGITDNPCLCISLCQDPYWYHVHTLQDNGRIVQHDVFGWAFHRRANRCFCVWRGKQKLNGKYKLQKHSDLITGFLDDIE